MGGLNELFEILRPAVCAIGSEWKDAIVTPVAPARKIGHRHQFDCRYSEFRQVVEPTAHSRERPARCEGAHMELIDDCVFPAAAMPGLVLPVERRGIDHFAGAVHVLWLEAGSWVGDRLCIVDLKMVTVPGPGRISY